MLRATSARPSLAVFLLLASCAGLAAPATVSAQGYGLQRYDPAARQVPSPASRPTFSPYLNLLRNNRVGLNYYGIVRPEIDFRASEDRLQSGLNRLDDRVTRQQNYSLNQAQLGRSGHASQYMVDLRGRPENIAMDMRDRRMQSAGQLQQFGRMRPTTGHSAYFGNGGSYFPTR